MTALEIESFPFTLNPPSPDIPPVAACVALKNDQVAVDVRQRARFDATNLAHTR
jgi:hypothetical protein